MRTKTLIAVAITAATLTGCDAIDCIPTQMQARDVGVADTGDVEESSVLRATLTAEGEPLPGQRVSFLMDDRSLGSAETSARGVATLDLKGRPLTLVRTVRSDSYDAVFAGAGTQYCSSADQAEVRLIKTE